MTRHNWAVIGLGALVEAAPAYLWYLLLHHRVGSADPALGLGTLFLASLFASLLAAWMEERALSPRLWPWLAGLGGALAAGVRLLLQPAFWTTEPVLAPVALFWAWYRGLGLAWSGDDNGEALRRFRSAILGMAAGALVAPLVGGRGAAAAMQASALLAVGGLLVSGLMLLALTHQAEVRKALAKRGVGGAGRGTGWTAAAGVAVFALFGLALEGSQLAAGGRIASLLRPLRPFWDVAAALLEGILVLVIRVLTPLAAALMWLLRRGVGVLFRLEQMIGEMGLRADGQQPGSLSGSFRLDARWQAILALLVSALAAFLLIRRTLRRHWERTLEEGLVEVHESIWSWPGLSPANLLKALLGLVRRQAFKGTGVADGLDPAQTRREEMRHLYRRYLALGQELGQPRQVAETPGRYQFRFITGLMNTPTAAAVRAAADPSTAAAASQLTRAYEETRYGEIEPEETRLDAAKQALARLEEDSSAARSDGSTSDFTRVQG